MMIGMSTVIAAQQAATTAALIATTAARGGGSGGGGERTTVFCFRCEHFRGDSMGREFGLCAHPDSVARESKTAVTGHSKPNASIPRVYGPCFRNGVLFEKASPHRRVLNATVFQLLKVPVVTVLVIMVAVWAL